MHQRIIGVSVWLAGLVIFAIIPETALAQAAIHAPPGFGQVRPGTVEVRGLQNLPMGAAMKSAALARLEDKRQRGWMSAEEQQAATLDGYFDDSEVKKRLRPGLAEVAGDLNVTPSNLDFALLKNRRVSGAMAAGGFVNGAWTGLARVMTVPGIGRVVLEEYDYVAAGSHIVVAAELFDTEVNGLPAVINVWRTPLGKAWTEAQWFTSNKQFRLLLGREIKKTDLLYEQLQVLMANLN
jgi:hypothetical protein